MTELTAAVREAQADADRRFGDGPVQPWEPPPVLSDATRRRLAMMALVSLLAAALFAAMAVAKTTAAARAVPAEPMQPPASLPAVVVASEVEAPDPPAPPTVTPPGLVFERQGAGWRLAANGAVRQEVVRRLVEASGSRLYGSPDAMADARPLRLQWQGRALAQVWPLVLGPDLSYALQCRRDRCDVWILGPAGTTATVASTGAPPVARELPPAALPMPMPMPIADDDTSPDRD